jgi:hypothetical protein
VTAVKRSCLSCPNALSTHHAKQIGKLCSNYATGLVETPKQPRDTSYGHAIPLRSLLYCDSGAIIYDERTDEVLGIATVGDWAVELAWQDAAARAVRD